MPSVTSSARPVKAISSDFPPPPPRPNRSVRLERYDSGTGAGSLVITERRKADAYVFERVPSDFGEAFLVLKVSEPGQDVYAVLLDPADRFHTCECKGFLRWGGICRHIGCLLALRSRGKI